MNRLEYLMERYGTTDIEILECRVPFDYKDAKYDKLNDDEFIHMINEIEKLDKEDILKILNTRGIDCYGI